ncbi:MAG: glucose-1-phosphate thymidylyltransferase RfbA [Rhodospirillaceae bacterium]|jgi:glucose-1-phosphate thymidylyltransferase|nr:glucose-1-phosphate thymidylyltransferase RfbA [Rhodospirillaceae bacterium]MBT3929410.1 glucose-1-phosphate thymidylyltransferase RfbA [Rhodospirillaceae bacterium]MBT4773705.1 glucose-1-phosphate thymidylyltransferase RfbA [Rhodospirillaceae bacterium]MBT5770628.1 glucose-1-phosphate thymidylyltransferase RfbA [Rhodospirillaceae bacterium]MBT6308601.1 glucose-1-phosphate thymidylyltransferase RfbA [Rhodospirillaceae bacterium]
MKGILLAGGLGERLFPITRATSKQLLPVYDKPMIFYPLCALMQAGAREVLIIVRPTEEDRFRSLLSDGSQWGMDISYAIQPNPNGIAEAPLIGADFLGDAQFALALGDNIFCGGDFDARLATAATTSTGATIFLKRVEEPGRYGVVEFAADERPRRIVEKPENPPSDYAVTGLYIYDGDAVSMARGLKPSARGELEITDLNNAYLARERLSVVRLSDDDAWLDMGTPEGLLEASQFVASEQQRRGERIGVPEHIGLRNGWVDASGIERLAASYGDNDYGRYLRRLIGDV